MMLNELEISTLTEDVYLQDIEFQENVTLKSLVESK